MAVAVHLGPVEADQPAVGASARRNPSGSNHGSAMRCSRSARVQPPWSGRSANAAALRASQSASSRCGVEERRVIPAGSTTGSSGANSERRICQSRRTRWNPCEAASSVAAASAPCAHRRSRPGGAPAGARARRPAAAEAAAAGRGAHRQLGARPLGRVGDVEVGVAEQARRVLAARPAGAGSSVPPWRRCSDDVLGQRVGAVDPGGSSASASAARISWSVRCAVTRMRVVGCTHRTGSRRVAAVATSRPSSWRGGTNR